MFYLDHPTSEEFFKVYKGILPELDKICEHMTVGPCVAVEVIKGKNSVEEFRDLCGPHDPDIGKMVRKNTIRA